MHVHAKHVRIIFTPKSIFAYQHLELLFLFGVLFTHFHETGLTVSVLNGLNGGAEERIVPCMGITELYLAHAVLKSHLLK